ncbi:MAG TPA: hypothetical protein VHO69_01005 [Phototrophicaceae bacterium]|nr:hypothetical protein [Phototrophicaceae bacterium]
MLIAVVLGIPFLLAVGGIAAYASRRSSPGWCRFFAFAAAFCWGTVLAVVLPARLESSFSEAIALLGGIMTYWQLQRGCPKGFKRKGKPKRKREEIE